jgi:tetraacyldisaccharide 4'-kinase
LARLVAKETEKRLINTHAYTSSLPVICVGNITLGGSGKTPVVQSIAHYLYKQGKRPAILLRGYGGSQKKPLLVDPEKHKAKQVGDEALLHARHFPTVVAQDRAAGAQLIEKRSDCDVIIMDDGFQNPTLEKTLSLVVVDGTRGWGNGHVIPAGPLREPLEHGIARADALVIMGQDTYIINHDAHFKTHILQATFTPDAKAIDALKGYRVIAFAGIGHPDKFFDMLRASELQLIETRAFGDHQPLSRSVITTLYHKAQKNGARLVTTAKDAMRLPPDLRAHVSIVDGHVMWQDKQKLHQMLKEKSIL